MALALPTAILNKDPNTGITTSTDINTGAVTQISQDDYNSGIAASQARIAQDDAQLAQIQQLQSQVQQNYNSLQGLPSNTPIPPPSTIPATAPIGAPPVIINTTTGVGVPGGFDGASLKDPTNEVNNTVAAISSTNSQLSQLNAAASSPCVLSGKISIPNLLPSISSLKNQLNIYAVKLNIALKAPKFSNPFTLPTPPRLPTLPNFSSLGVPKIPLDPCIQVPSIPSINTPSIPPINTPSIPPINVLSVPSLISKL